MTLMFCNSKTFGIIKSIFDTKTEQKRIMGAGILKIKNLMQGWGLK